MTTTSTQEAGTFLTRSYQRFLRAIVGKGWGDVYLAQRGYKLFTSCTSYFPMPTATAHGVKIHQNLFIVLHGPDYSQPFEIPSTELIQREVKEGQVVLDIGAHVGYYTCVMAKQVGPGGHVYAFEPGYFNLRMLRKNLKSNGLNNLTLTPKAVSDVSGTQYFYEHGAQSSIGHKQLSHLLPTGKVETVILDEVLKDVPRIDFIKMDIEGSEAKALRGMKRILSGDVKILMEFFPGLIKKAGDDPRVLLEYLAGFGFKFYDVQSEDVTKPMTIDEIFAKYSPDSRKVSNLTNLLCKKG